MEKELEFSVLECKKCGEKFQVNNDFMGIITCPYCGEYVEG